MRKITFFTSLFVVLFILTGCNNIENTTAADYVPAATPPIPVERVAVPTELADDVYAAAICFAQRLFRQMLHLPDTENLVISPLSAYYALAMAALGADGVTLEEFEQVLARDPFVLAPELAELAACLMTAGGSTELTVAGSVWICDKYTIPPDFNRRMTDYFGATAFSRDFRDESTVSEINQWVYDQTNGLIDGVLGEIPNDTMMYLINTLYMYAKWSGTFRPMTERERMFTPEGDEARMVDFLTAGDGWAALPLYARVTDAYEAVLLPYDDDRLGFFMVRPTGGQTVRDFAQTVDFLGIFAELELQKSVVVHMPALDKDFEFEMVEALQAMGLEAAFCEGRADFLGLVEYLPSGIPGFFISDVQQMVRLIVDSEGTEAAAATIISIVPTSMPYPPPLVLDFNTPYIYAIIDLQTGVPLFIGVVDAP